MTATDHDTHSPGHSPRSGLTTTPAARRWPRAGFGSLTVLGDLAQGTTPWAARSRPEHLGIPQAAVVPLTTGFRVPATIVALANRLLGALRVEVPPARSLRRDGSLRIRQVARLTDAAIEVVRDALGQEGSIAVIAAEPDAARVSRELETVRTRPPPRTGPTPPHASPCCPRHSPRGSNTTMSSWSSPRPSWRPSRVDSTGSMPSSPGPSPGSMCSTTAPCRTPGDPAGPCPDSMNGPPANTTNRRTETQPWPHNGSRSFSSRAFWAPEKRRCSII